MACRPPDRAEHLSLAGRPLAVALERCEGIFLPSPRLLQPRACQQCAAKRQPPAEECGIEWPTSVRCRGSAPVPRKKSLAAADTSGVFDLWFLLAVQRVRQPAATEPDSECLWMVFALERSAPRHPRQRHDGRKAAHAKPRVVPDHADDSLAAEGMLTPENSRDGRWRRSLHVRLGARTAQRFVIGGRSQVPGRPRRGETRRRAGNGLDRFCSCGRRTAHARASPGSRRKGGTR